MHVQGLVQGCARMCKDMQNMQRGPCLGPSLQGSPTSFVTFHFRSIDDHSLSSLPRVAQSIAGFAGTDLDFAAAEKDASKHNSSNAEVAGHNSRYPTY